VNTIPDGGLPAETVQMLNQFIGWAWWLALLILVGSGIAAGGALAWQRSQGVAESEAAQHLLRVAVIACAISTPATIALTIIQR
jgi:hypothetical protein